MPNRLVNETSPYLLQHANNPVDWYPWGDEAFQRARELNCPLFLSIGYSACHWCHVMEHESFENPAIAEQMNAGFVCVKVDREERPDLDAIYMTSVQLLTRRGGWPMSVFLTHDGQPFYGGTYWPPFSRGGMPGFRDVLRAIRDAWDNRHEALLDQAKEITEAIVSHSGVRDRRTKLTLDLLRTAEHDFLQSADRTLGGFGHAPKFPHPMALRVLLRTWQRFRNPEALNVATVTLDRMANGGIYDQLGGGFHRYSTDSRWLVPHFEKMLYDNALLVPAYLEAAQLTNNSDYFRVVTETLDYVLREMTQPQGGFYATQDADSEGVEGKFFVWQHSEIMSLLGSDDGRLVCEFYDVTPHGNWEETSILNRPQPLKEVAERCGVTSEELESVLARCRPILFAERSRRVPPGRDDKVLASWNGMMIAAFARAAFVLDRPDYLEAAQRAADFILSTMVTEDSRLLHSFKDGQARLNGYLDDYACLIDGLVDLFEASQQARYLTSALQLADRLIDRFADRRGSGFYFTSSDHETLITRMKDAQDNATPSGNGMAATALLRLARLCSRSDLERSAVQTLELLSGQMEQLALASGQSLLALELYLGPACELVVFEGADAEHNAAVRTCLREWLPPSRSLIIRSFREVASAADQALTAHLAGRAAINDQATLYLCENGTCQAPAIGVAAIQAALNDLRHSPRERSL